MGSSITSLVPPQMRHASSSMHNWRMESLWETTERAFWSTQDRCSLTMHNSECRQHCISTEDRDCLLINWIRVLITLSTLHALCVRWLCSCFDNNDSLTQSKGYQRWVTWMKRTCTSQTRWKTKILDCHCQMAVPSDRSLQQQASYDWVMDLVQ